VPYRSGRNATSSIAWRVEVPPSVIKQASTLIAILFRTLATKD
jgi:hypothetical protein